MHSVYQNIVKLQQIGILRTLVPFKKAGALSIKGSAGTGTRACLRGVLGETVSQMLNIKDFLKIA